VPREQRSRFPQQGRRTLTCHLWGFLLNASILLRRHPACPTGTSNRTIRGLDHQKPGLPKSRPTVLVASVAITISGAGFEATSRTSYSYVLIPPALSWPFRTACASLACTGGHDGTAASLADSTYLAPLDRPESAYDER
jgi:hypothetical protein